MKTIRDTYLDAVNPKKPNIFKANSSEWYVFGQGLSWLGVTFSTWREAIDFANDYVRNYRTSR